MTTKSSFFQRRSWQNLRSDKGTRVGVEEVLLAQEGDRDAFARLVEVHTPALQSLVRGWERNPQEAADLVQETWLKVFRQIKRLHHPEKFAAWLFSIARRTHVDRLRSEKRRVQPLQGDAESDGANEWEQVPDPSSSPSETTMGRQEVDRIHTVIDRTGERYRIILRLRLLHDLSTPEIASLLDLKESTVRMRLNRGLGKIRKILEKEGLAP